MDNILPRESSTDDSSGSDSEDERERWSEMGLVVLLPTKVSSLFFSREEQKRIFVTHGNVQISEEQLVLYKRLPYESQAVST